MPAPRCAECEKSGQTPRQIYPLGSRSTLLGGNFSYYEDGEFHSHDPNAVTTGYRCSRGHEWSETSHRPCPTCGDWKEEKT